VKKKEDNSLEISHPPQMSLFEMIGEKYDDYSNTIELYDVLPKYYYGNNVNRTNDKYLDVIERDFTFRSRKFKMKITPATIKNAKGEEKAYYPSQREEIVEDAIRKIAIEKGGVFIDGGAGVQFSIYELANELKKRGHGYQLLQIKEAIEICHNTSINIKSEDGKDEMSFHMMESIGFSTRDNDQTKSFVKFNSLVTKSINKQTFRLFNYKKCMSLKYMLSRWLFKRISHHFIQASASNPYTIKLTTVVRDSGMNQSQRLSDASKQVTKSLNELVQKKVFLKYDFDRILDVQKKNKLADIVYSIWLSDSFCKDVKKANYRNQLIDDKEEQGELLDFHNELEKEMQNEIFKLSSSSIKSMLKNVTDKEDFESTMLALAAAKEVIEEYTAKNIKHNAVALVKVALKEKWFPKFQEEETSEDEVEQDFNFNDLTKAESKTFRILLEKIEKELGDDTFKSWFSKVHYHGNGGGVGELHLSFPSQFVTQYIKDNFEEEILKVAKEIDEKVEQVVLIKR
jgi:hypothetical protein